jgi:hypothetical protein
VQKEKIINSKRQQKNLKGFLSSSKFDFHESSPSVKKCTDKRCMICPSLIEGTSFTFKNGRTENIVIPWFISSYKRNYIILIWGYMYLFPQFRMYRSFFQRFLYTMFNYFKYNLSSHSRVSLNSSVFVIVIILEAKLNGMFILICFGWLDLKLRYIWVSVSFEKMSVIMLLFVDIRIKTSKNGISILLLFTVKRTWSFKELSSVWKISTGMSEFHIIKQSSRKRLQFCRTYDANSWPLDHIHSLKKELQ